MELELLLQQKQTVQEVLAAQYEGIIYGCYWLPVLQDINEQIELLTLKQAA
jgi:hypothetical protein